MNDGEPATTWNLLAAESPDPPAVFDHAMIAGLPGPAQRFLQRALPVGTPLGTLVELEMRGEIRLGGRWSAFEAQQILRAGVGFVWRPSIGGRFLHFSGFDCCGPHGAEMDFRLHHLIPVARASGPDTVRSASGRLAAETVAWVPQALVPANGARWTAIDDERALVTLLAAHREVEVAVRIDDVGRLRSLGLRRWSTVEKPPGLAPFGGLLCEDFITADGVTIARTGSVGWGWDTPGWSDGEFFRFEVTSAQHRA